MKSLILILALAACGERQQDPDSNMMDGSSVLVDTNNDGIADTLDGVQYYQELVNRPDCNDEIDQVMVFINEENSFYKCEANNWKAAVFVAKRGE